MEIAGNIYIDGIQLLSRLRWLRTPRHDTDTLGQGPFRYRIDRHWCRANRMAMPVNNCHEMVIDSRQRLYLLTDYPRNNMLVLSPAGEVIDSWTLNSSGAHGLTLSRSNGTEFLWICDPYRPSVVKTTLDGKVLQTLPNPADIGVYTRSDPYAPTQTAVAANGDIYVADGYGSQYVIQFNANGNYIRRFGGKGKQNFNLNFAHGIAIDARIPNRPVLLVTSRKASCIKRFTMDGDYLDEIRLPGGYPCRPVVYGDYILVSLCWSEAHLKPNSGFIIILDKDNHVCETLGGHAEIDDAGRLVRLKSDYSTFCHVHDVCADAMGNLYVCQWNAGKVYPYKLTKM